MALDWIKKLDDSIWAPNVAKMVVWEGFGELFAISQSGDGLIWYEGEVDWAPVGFPTFGFVGLLAYEPVLDNIYTVGEFNQIFVNNYEDWLERTSNSIIGEGFRDMVTLNGDIYAGGDALYYFEVIDFNNVNEGVQVAPAPTGAGDNRINKLIVRNTDIYMGTPSGELYYFAGGSWIQVAPFHVSNDIITDLVLLDGSVYALYQNSGKILRWNDEDDWEWMNYNESSRYSLSLVVFNGAIYRGCGNIGDSGLWKLNTLTGVCDLINNPSGDLSSIAALTVYNEKIYGGGS